MSDLEQVPYDEVMTWILAGQSMLLFRRPLEEGCDHRLIRLPLFQFTIDYHCQTCHGMHQQTYTPDIAALGSMENIDQRVASQVGGNVVAEVVVKKAGATA